MLVRLPSRRCGGSFRHGMRVSFVSVLMLLIPVPHRVACPVSRLRIWMTSLPVALQAQRFHGGRAVSRLLARGRSPSIRAGPSATRPALSEPGRSLRTRC